VPDFEMLLGYRYPHTAASAIPAKLTATEIKSRVRDSVEDAEAQSLLQQRHYGFRMPALAEETALTGAERGTATHRLLQHIRFEATDCASGIASEIERLRAQGVLSDAEAEAVDVQAVERFFLSDTGRLLRSGAVVLREQRFSMLMPAADYFPGGEGEEILLQGVVDCCVVEPDGLVILDFKTDRVSGEALKKRAAGYMPQLCAYAKAMARLLKKPVKRCVLAFLFPGEEVEIPLP